MSNTEIHLVIQPARSYSQKRRLAKHLRANGKPEEAIKKIVWHPENSPKKGKS